MSAWWFGCHFLFSHILGISSSQLTFIFFRGVAQPPTRCGVLNVWHVPPYHADRDPESTFLVVFGETTQTWFEICNGGKLWPQQKGWTSLRRYISLHVTKFPHLVSDDVLITMQPLVLRYSWWLEGSIPVNEYPFTNGQAACPLTMIIDHHVSGDISMGYT